MNQYSNRRQKVIKSLPNNSAVLIFSGRAPQKSEDEAYDFSVNRNFYYLTGLDKEEMALLMYNIDGTTKEIMFILPFDEQLARWVGGRLSSEKVREISEVNDAREYDQLDGTISYIMNNMRRDNSFKFYFDLWQYNMKQNPSEGSLYAKKLQDTYPAVVIKDIYPVLTHLRLIKDEYEISCIRKAIHTTNMGILQMMRTSKPGINEMTMDGVFDFVLRQSMCKETAFKTIAASGARATILHYSDNDQIMKDGEMFLCDLGATYNYYKADISRTFPVNGKFTERQKELYQIVLNAQRIVEDNARVGIKIKDLNQMVIDYYKTELPKHGLNKDVSEYYFHSCSHHLGLDTHDVDGGLGATLEAGMVITNEPGLYIEDENIGIRIEDDLLITGTGAEVLSSEIIKEIDEIERTMNNG